MKTLRNLLSAPVFENDEEKTRLAKLLNVILITVMALLMVFSVPALLLTPQVSRILIEGTLAVWSLFMLVVLRRGYVRQAAFLMSLTLWTVVSYGTYEAGGFRGSIMASYLAIILIAELLLGTRSGIIFGILSILFTGWLAFADSYGLIPPQAEYATLPTLWGEFSAVAIGVVVITSLTVNSLHEALARARKNEQELAIKVQESQELAKHLSENYAFLESFIRRIGHEARTPLGIMLGYAEILTEDPLSATQKSLLGRIINNAESLKSLFNGLLDTSQIESGQLHLNKQEFPPQELVTMINATYLLLANNKNLYLKVELDKQMPATIYGDRDRIGQILSNLISNAIKFTKQGGIDIHIRKADDEHWKIEVYDSGVGIPQEAQAYIFDAFRQADESPTRQFGGVGLGLSIVRELATLMGGTASVSSIVDQGSIFTVVLPF